MTWALAFALSGAGYAAGGMGADSAGTGGTGAGGTDIAGAGTASGGAPNAPPGVNMLDFGNGADFNAIGHAVPFDSSQ